MPKSVTFAGSPSGNRILPGLRSPCTSPASWAACSGRDVAGYRQGTRDVESAFSMQHLCQRRAGHQLHHDVRSRSGRSAVVDSDDVGVGDAGLPHLVTKDGHEAWVVREAVDEDLHGHVAFEPDVAGAMNDPRVAGANRLEQLVAPAEQRAAILALACRFPVFARPSQGPSRSGERRRGSPPDPQVLPENSLAPSLFRNGSDV
jgi:hypothetical protein